MTNNPGAGEGDRQPEPERLKSRLEQLYKGNNGEATMWVYSAFRDPYTASTGPFRLVIVTIRNFSSLALDKESSNWAVSRGA